MARTEGPGDRVRERGGKIEVPQEQKKKKETRERHTITLAPFNGLLFFLAARPFAPFSPFSSILVLFCFLRMCAC